MKLSIIVPAHNEEQNIGNCIDELRRVLVANAIGYEIIVVNDNSGDGTQQVVRAAMLEDPAVRLVDRKPPSGFGRAVRSGLEAVTGDVVVIYMADLSDDPDDVIAYYRKIEEGYDCVFGSRFIKRAKVENYPPVKRIVNRIVNKCIQYLFWTKFNDLTNAFKAYRVQVVRDCGPYHASHFNITIEMSLGALIRRYNIAQIPIRWYGRTWGSSNLRLTQMGRRYLEVALMLFFQRWLVVDDLIADRLARNDMFYRGISDLEARVQRLEERIADDRPEPSGSEREPVKTDGPLPAARPSDSTGPTPVSAESSRD